MMKKQIRLCTQKTLLAASLCALLPVTAMADQYVWGSLNGTTTDPATCAASPDAVAVTFTMINAIGEIVPNGDAVDTSDPGDLIAFSGFQTPTCGSVTFDTATQTGAMDIVAFSFFGSGGAVAKSITMDALQSPQDLGIGSLLLTNMLFDWNGNVGIPVSLVWDAQGLLNEMDGTPSSFTLNADGSIATAGNYSQGAAPASDGSTQTVTGAFPFDVTLNTGPSPLAMRTENTANLSINATECQLGADADFSNNAGGGCMGIAPSADKTALLLNDSAENPLVATPNTLGYGGNSMQDGPFGGFNANFDVSAVKLISFTDTTPPLISLISHGSPTGTGTVTIVGGVDTYTEPGATCDDAAPLHGNVITVGAPTGGTVDDSVTGIGSTTTLTYTCTDPSGNSVTMDRIVNVVAPNAVITLNGTNPVSHECGIAYVDAGASCNDDPDGVIALMGNGTDPSTFAVNAAGVSITTVGSYNAVWNCTDADSNNSIINRVVNVVDTASPVVTIPGANPLNIEVTDQGAFTLPVATALDANGDCSPVTGAIATTGTVNFTVPDGVDSVDSPILYTAVDSSVAANTGTVSLVVRVSRSEPVITLNGSPTVVLTAGDTYTEEGMTIHDVQDGDVATVLTSGSDTATGITYTVAGNVDASTNGTYQVIYDVTDTDGNTAQVVRSILVGSYAVNSNFTMLNASGENAGGGANDVTFVWNGSVGNTDETGTNFDMQIVSVKPTLFFGFPWQAHHIRTFGPGTYTFDSDNATCDIAAIEATGCPGKGGPLDITITVGSGQIGGHMLFDYNGNVNIDVVNVWDVNAAWNDPDGNKAIANPLPGATVANDLYLQETNTPPDVDTTWLLVSTDVNGDGFNGSPMLEAPFPGFYANFNAGPQTTAAPPPPCGAAEGCDIEGTSLGSDPISATGLLTLLVSFLTLFGLRRVCKD